VPRSSTTWIKGQSGNPKGSTKGFEKKHTRLIRQIVERSSPKIVENIAKDAEAGDREAQALFMRHLLPPRPRPIETPLSLAKPQSAKQAVEQIAFVMSSLARGGIGMDEAKAIIDALHVYLSALPTSDLEIKFRELGLIMLQRRQEPPA
jgi:hypothetical protein